MEEFRHRITRRGEPEALLLAVARKLQGLPEWRIDSQTELFLTATSAAGTGFLGRLIGDILGAAWGRQNVPRELEADYRVGQTRDPPREAGRHVLAAETAPASGGAQLELRGSGRKGARLARLLLQGLEGVSDADLRRVARQ